MSPIIFSRHFILFVILRYVLASLYGEPKIQSIF